MRYSILIVEDERIVAKDLEQTLVEMGYDAYATAVSSAEAIARVAEKRPDLVLMDIRIKGAIDGIATAALLREQFGVPIVYLTAHADDATLDRAKHTEPYGYLMKPVRAAELRSVVEVAIFKHQRERAALDAHATRVAHRVNTPLGVVVSNASFVLHELQRQQQLGVGDAAQLAQAIEVQSELATAATQIAREVAELQPVTGRAERPTSPAATGLRGRILVIDDDALTLRMMKRMLRHHDVSCVDRAQTALDLLGRGERFDVILSDMMMPGLTGMQLYARLEAEFPEQVPRVVFLTGGAVGVEAIAFLATVKNHCLDKPIVQEALHAILQHMLAAASGP